VADKKLPKLLTSKEKRRLAQIRFTRARNAEKQYQRQLSAVGNQVGTLIDGFAPGGKVSNMGELVAALRRYAAILKPWARSVTERMHADVDRRDASSWAELAREMGRELRKELRTAPIGKVFRTLMDEQVSLITSIPTEAAERVHAMAREALVSTSARADQLQKAIMRSGQVAAGRAKLIARTETSRTAALLTEARAQYVGSTHYRWHSSEDAQVRPRHRQLNKKIFRWDDPPDAGEPGHPMRYNPGCGPNCRCWAEPILPDLII